MSWSMFLLITSLAGGSFQKSTTLLKWQRKPGTEIGKVSASDEFNLLTLTVAVIDYIKNEDIVIPNRDPILIACIKWVDYQPVSCKDNMLDMVKHVKLEKRTCPTLHTMIKKIKELITDPIAM